MGRLLWTTGGVLEFLKRSYFLLIWEFKETQEPYVKKEEHILKNDMSLKDSDGYGATLKRIGTHEGIKFWE